MDCNKLSEYCCHYSVKIWECHHTVRTQVQYKKQSLGKYASCFVAPVYELLSSFSDKQVFLDVMFIELE